MDFSTSVKEYILRLWCLESIKIIYSTNMFFDESSMLKNQNKISESDSNN